MNLIARIVGRLRDRYAPCGPDNEWSTPDGWLLRRRGPGSDVNVIMPDRWYPIALGQFRPRCGATPAPAELDTLTPSFRLDGARTTRAKLLGGGTLVVHVDIEDPPTHTTPTSMFEAAPWVTGGWWARYGPDGKLVATERLADPDIDVVFVSADRKHGWHFGPKALISVYILGDQ